MRKKQDLTADINYFQCFIGLFIAYSDTSDYGRNNNKELEFMSENQSSSIIEWSEF